MRVHHHNRLRYEIIIRRFDSLSISLKHLRRMPYVSGMSSRYRTFHSANSSKGSTVDHYAATILDGFRYEFSMCEYSR